MALNKNEQPSKSGIKYDSGDMSYFSSVKAPKNLPSSYESAKKRSDRFWWIEFWKFCLREYFIWSRLSYDKSSKMVVMGFFISVSMIFIRSSAKAPSIRMSESRPILGSLS